MKLRRFFTISLLIIVIGSISVGVNYLYNFDLNSFREEIEALASERISRPLTLGNAHLSFKHGPAFAFDNVTIGSQKDNLYLDVEKLYFRIQTLPLLSGKILFSEILLEKPDFSITLQPSESEVPPFQFIAEQRLLTGEFIKSLRVLNGTIRVKDSRGGRAPETVVIEKLRFSIDDFSFLSAGNIKTRATLLYRGIRSPLSLEGEYHPQKNTTGWDTAFYQFKLSIENLAANTLSHSTDNLKKDFALRGFADLELQMKGSPKTGLTFDTKLTGKNLTLTKSTTDTPPMSISQGSLSGRLQYEKKSIKLESIKLTLDTDYGRMETESESRLTLSGDSVNGIFSQGRLSIRLASDTEQSTHPFFTRHLIASYRVDLNRTKHGWKATKGEFTLPGLDFGFHGQWHDSDNQPHALIIDLPDASLPAVTALMPGLSRLKLNGRIAAHLSLDIQSNRPLQTVASLNLAGVSLAIPGPLADLNRLNGQIELHNKNISAKRLQAELGNSPITVDLNIPDFTNPDINLHVLSDSIRADELIFTTETKYLEQVDGIVRIANGTVFLGPIHVRMDGGTNATVNGTVRNFAAADVALEIQGQHGNIDEIIALWKGDHPRPAATTPRPMGKLTIDISTDSGQISGMHFDHATSQIVQRNGTLVIGPIRFRAGSGEGLGQVLLAHQDDGSSLLKISGNLKNFDAQTVYQQILKRNGLVSGHLNSDFYLEGIAGEQFLPTSLGAFSVEIEDGRLNKLTGLSKILHILNLYPILTENVQGKGLPYDKISFNAALNKGLLTTDDFLMKGDIMNLSMVGEYNVNRKTVNFELGAMPLSTVDSILSHIPIAGWLLTGSKKALLIAHFEMTGDADDPDIKSIPIESITEPVIGILKRVFTFPVKIITDPEKVLINQ